MGLRCTRSSGLVLGRAGGVVGGGGDVPECNRGGMKLRSSMGRKVNIDVEDGDEDEDEDGDEDEDDDFDQMFDQIGKESHGNEEDSVQQLTRPILETQILSPATIHVLSTLAGSCRAVTSSTATVFNNATEVLKSLTTGHQWDSIQSSFQENTLLDIAHRCELSERLVESSQVIYALNLIQFRTKIES